MTQPVVIAENPANRNESVKESLTKTIPVQRSNTDVRAALIKLADDGQPIANQAILINHNNFIINIKSDSIREAGGKVSIGKRSQVLISSDPEDRFFFLTELDPQAGILVNYSPVPASGIKLNNGDVIHFGRLTYQFKISNPEQ